MKKLLQLRQEDNEERKRKTQQGDTDLTWKNLSNKERKKPRALASETSLYRGVFTNAGDFTDATHPNRRLTRGLYIGGNLGLRRSVSSLRRRASLHSSEVGLYFVEFG